jgi:hypothetical protein
MRPLSMKKSESVPVKKAVETAYEIATANAPG